MTIIDRWLNSIHMQMEYVINIVRSGFYVISI